MSAVAGGSSTLSKYRSQFPVNFPTHLVAAAGASVWSDADHKYTDWISGGLAVLLGHNHPEVHDEVNAHLVRGGPTWSLPHRLEEMVAATILRLTGFSGGKVRFFKTGSEACSAAVRIARAMTGHDLVIDLGTYHGWHDQFQHSPPAWGVVRGYSGGLDSDAVVRKYGVPDAGDMMLSAAVIVEPDTDNLRLQELRERCRAHNALLIFDECKSGGRYPEFTAARHLGVQPDLLVLSKCLANGWPLACVVGTADVMACLEPGWRDKGPVYVSGTYSGETASLAAARATLRVWERDKVADHLELMGRKLRSRLEVAARHGVTIGGHFYRVTLEAPSPAIRTAVAAFLADQGHLIAPFGGWNPTAAHVRDDVEGVAAAFGAAMDAIDQGYDGGRPVAPLYR